MWRSWMRPKTTPIRTASAWTAWKTSSQFISLHDRKPDPRSVRPREHLLRRRAIILRLPEEDVRHIGLRVAVVERKPARLHLHHQTMSRLNDIVYLRQGELVGDGLVRGQRRCVRRIGMIT